MKKGFAAVFLAVLCTFLFYGIRYMKSPLLTQKAVYGTYEDSVSTNCFFAREENVYTAGTSGTVYDIYSDGTRINKNSPVAAIYSGNVSEENIQAISTIDKKIENTDVTILLINENIIKSQWVNQEIECSIRNNNAFVLIVPKKLRENQEINKFLDQFKINGKKITSVYPLKTFSRKEDINIWAWMQEALRNNANNL